MINGEEENGEMYRAGYLERKYFSSSGIELRWLKAFTVIPLNKHLFLTVQGTPKIQTIPNVCL